MNIYVVAVGSIKEKFFVDAIGEYKKRLSRYCKYEIIEVKDEKTPQNASNLEEEKIKEIEGERILGKIKEKSYVIALAIEGGQISSEGLAKKMSELETRSRGNLYFVIGGSLGLSSKVLSQADEKLSFSLMTFPHQLMRVILSEQIYRSYRIRNHEPYHK